MNIENTKLTCPDCRGALERIQDGKLLQYRCRVGHTYSAETAVAAHALTEENALWAGIVALEEGADLWEDVAGMLNNENSQLLREQAKTKREIASGIRELLNRLEVPRLE
ncbi:MAG TPA: hypothetical protein VJQ59_08560 [Candidatus Sulfotelmatobacter sp.]|nr:hypothetical protein [Candidatus Sulfotelmatobacter sp.]